MPWIVGLVTPEEKTRLLADGHQLDEVPSWYLDGGFDPAEKLECACVWVNVWVDADVCRILEP